MWKSQGEESASWLPKYSSKWISIFFSLPNSSNNKKQISVFHTAYHKGYILGKNSNMAYKSHPISAKVLKITQAPGMIHRIDY